MIQVYVDSAVAAVEDGEEQFARARGRTNIYTAATPLPAMLSTM